MKTSGNTILITGGASGIGLEIAAALKSEGNTVIVAGRSAEKLERAKTRGMEVVQMDMRSDASIREVAGHLIRQYPDLNSVIHNAGVMMNEKVLSRDNSEIAKETFETNLLGPIFLTNALLPHFQKQAAAAIITVTSGLAFVPLAMTPSYSASKAAIHSYTLSLRYQLKDTKITVKELIPPYVRTALMGERQKADPNAMPLEEFVSEVMSLLKSDPQAPEIAVKRVQPQRTAGFDAPAFEAFFNRQNEMLMAARKTEWDAL